MHAVILAAGEGSRLGPHAEDVPKAFIDLAGRTLYDRQSRCLRGYVDDVTVVLGYAAANVLEEITDARTIVIDDWDAYENAESLRRGLTGVDDDVLVLNGDVVVTEAAIARVIDAHRTATDRSVVACIPGYQDHSTAIRCNDDGVVTRYGMITGHRHAGMGIIDRTHLDDARAYLGRHREEWYPGLYTAVETEMVPIPAAQHIEINYPRDLFVARRKLPLEATDGLDLQT
ncbi:MAG: NTP transferase domain-containing protein [Halorientalis sp.]